LSNAIKFTEQGYVKIIAEIIENYLRITVKDTGVGIKDEDKSKLFKLFGFLDETQNVNTSGIGLGLVIAD
jgi:signal transduction histidine kinase